MKTALISTAAFFTASLLTFWLWPWKPLQILGMTLLLWLGVGG